MAAAEATGKRQRHVRQRVNTLEQTCTRVEQVDQACSPIDERLSEREHLLLLSEEEDDDDGRWYAETLASG